MAISRRFFYECIHYIQQDDVDNYLKLLKLAAKRDIDLSEMTDSDGSSMLHYLIKQENIELYQCAKRFYPSGWGQLKLENRHVTRDGTRVCDLFKKINDQSFRDGIIEAGQHQGHLMRQFRLYLDCQMIVDASKYDESEVEILRKSLDSGHCHGFALLFIQCFFCDGIAHYERLFYNIIHWSGRIDDLNPELIDEFEYALQMVLQYQVNQHMRETVKSGQKAKKIWQQSIIWNQATHVEVKQIKVAEILGKADFQQEGDIRLTFFPKGAKKDCGIKFLTKFFDKLVEHKENRGKALCITGGAGHTLVVLYTKKALILFDSNYKGDSLQDLKPYKCFKLKSYSKPTKKIAQEIYQQIYGIVSPSEEMNVAIIPIDERGKEYGSYYANQDYSWLQVYRKLRSEKKPRLSFMDFSEYGKILSHNLSNYELKNYYNSVTITEPEDIKSLMPIVGNAMMMQCVFSQLTEEQLISIIENDLQIMKNYCYISFSTEYLNYLYETFKFSLSQQNYAIFEDEILSQISTLEFKHPLSMFMSFRMHVYSINMPLLLEDLATDTSSMLEWPVEAQYFLLLYLVEYHDLPFLEEKHLYKCSYDRILKKLQRTTINLEKLSNEMLYGTENSPSLIELLKLPEQSLSVSDGFVESLKI